jgi:hypothetical protein
LTRAGRWQIFNQTIQGSFTNVTSTEASANLHINIVHGNTESMIAELIRVGIPKEAATEFANIVAEEKPGTTERPLGEGALSWLKRNLSKAADGTWKIALSVLTKVLEDAAVQYYNLK